MVQYISKSALVAEIERIEYETNYEPFTDEVLGKRCTCRSLLSFIDTLEVIDPYAQWIQYSSIEDGIKAHAEDYSFFIESELFNQLTKEQQKLWRKEIEQAAISGGYSGLELAKDPRYKENLEVKEVDLNKELSLEDYKSFFKKYPDLSDDWGFDEAWIFAKYFYELGLKAQKEEKV